MHAKPHSHISLAHRNNVLRLSRPQQPPSLSTTVTVPCSQVMVLLTANGLDQATLRALRRSGAVTVMVALLANESGAIQELACGCLANLLVTLGGGHWRVPCSGAAASSSSSSASAEASPSSSSAFTLSRSLALGGADRSDLFDLDDVDPRLVRSVEGTLMGS